MSDTTTLLPPSSFRVRRSTGTLVYMDMTADGLVRDVFERVGGQWYRLGARDICIIHYGSMKSVMGYERGPVAFVPNERDLRRILISANGITEEEAQMCIHILGWDPQMPAWHNDLLAAIENGKGRGYSIV